VASDITMGEECDALQRKNDLVEVGKQHLRGKLIGETVERQPYRSKINAGPKGVSAATKLEKKRTRQSLPLLTREVLRLYRDSLPSINKKRTRGEAENNHRRSPLKERKRLPKGTSESKLQKGET